MTTGAIVLPAPVWRAYRDYFEAKASGDPEAVEQAKVQLGEALLAAQGYEGGEE